MQTILAEAFKEAIAADKAMERPRSRQVCRVAVVSSESHRHASYLSHRDRFLLPTFVCTHQFPLMTALKSHYSRHFALNQLLSGRSSARFGSARTGARVAQHMRSQIAFGDSPLMMRALLALQEAGGWTRVSMTVKSKYKNAANRSI